MAKKKSHSELLGYFFIIFQTTLNGYVRCWIDGSENYTFITLEKFMEFFDVSKSPSELKIFALKCLDTTSMFYWDIDNEIIKRVTLQAQPSDIGERISNNNPFHKKSWG